MHICKEGIWFEKWTKLLLGNLKILKCGLMSQAILHVISQYVVNEL